jgi:GNAT superfamily N-acetyltransferase
MGLALRSATVSDAARIAAIHVHTWRVAYAHIFTTEFLAGLSVETRTAMWREHLEALPVEQRVDVAEEDGEVIGFCSSGPAKDADAGGLGEVYAVYVASSRWSRGAGSALMESARRSFLAAGYRQAVLWVLEANDTARVFYERRGWKPDGATKAYESGTTAIRYRTFLDSGPPAGSVASE